MMRASSLKWIAPAILVATVSGLHGAHAGSHHIRHLAPLACAPDKGVIAVQESARPTVSNSAYFAPVEFATFYPVNIHECARASAHRAKA